MTSQPQKDAMRRGSNQSGIRAFNERLVLSLIRQSGPLAKAEIARVTGLSAQTVSVIIRALEDDGLLTRGDPIRGRIGQPSVPMRLARDGAFFLGLKVGRRSLDLLLTNFLGQVQHRITRSHDHPDPDDTLRHATGMIDSVLAELPPEHRRRLAGMGMALPFQLWEWAEQAPGQMDGWRGRDIAAELGAGRDFPVFVCNDASAACGAELVFGDQNKPKDFLYFFVGYLVGGGLVLDNGLYTGATGNAAALGSMLVPVAQGNMRQLVEVASLAPLVREVAEVMPWDAPEDWSLPAPVLDNWLAEAAGGIAHAILSATSLIDFGHVYVDGWMPGNMRKALVTRIRDRLSATTLPGVEAPQVLPGTIGPDARALGAASLPLSERYLVERTTFQKGPAR